MPAPNFHNRRALWRLQRNKPLVSLNKELNTMRVDKKRKEILRLVSGCSDLTLPRDRLMDALLCDDANIESVLDTMGLDSCNWCGIWKCVAELNVEDPESPGNHLCDPCVAEKGLPSSQCVSTLPDKEVPPC